MNNYQRHHILYHWEIDSRGWALVRVQGKRRVTLALVIRYGNGWAWETRGKAKGKANNPGEARFKAEVQARKEDAPHPYSL